MPEPFLHIAFPEPGTRHAFQGTVPVVLYAFGIGRVCLTVATADGTPLSEPTPVDVHSETVVYATAVPITGRVRRGDKCTLSARVVPPGGACAGGTPGGGACVTVPVKVKNKSRAKRR
jgi:hypothetical protein